MTREEAEKLLANLGVKNEIAVRLASLSTEINVDVLANLLRLARLGLRVHCPSEEDVPADLVEKVCIYLSSMYGVGVGWGHIGEQRRNEIRPLISAALAALKGE